METSELHFQLDLWDVNMRVKLNFLLHMNYYVSYAVSKSIRIDFFFFGMNLNRNTKLLHQKPQDKHNKA